LTQEEIRNRVVELSQGPVWKSQRKELMLKDMDTDYCYNCLKVLYNSAAETLGMPTVQYLNRYRWIVDKAKDNPQETMMHMLVFMYAIEDRGDLDEKYRENYSKIVQILSGRKENLGAARIEAPTEISQVVQDDESKDISSLRNVNV
jgi:hypothetical protein